MKGSVVSVKSVAQPARSSRHAADWPEIVCELTTAAAVGQNALSQAGLRVARRLTGADGATLLRWRDGYCRVMGCSGEGVERLHRRPAEGPGRIDGRPVAVVSLDPRTDLVVNRHDSLPFDDDDVLALRAVAAMLRQTPAPPAALAALPDLAARLLACSDPDEVLAPVTDSLAELLKAEIAGVLLLEGDHLVMRRVVGNRTLETARLRAGRGEGLTGRVLETGRPERIDDYATDPSIGKEFLAVAEREGTCSAVCAPLWSNGRAIGVIAAWRRRRTPFTAADERLLVELAGITAAAVGHSLLDAEAQAAAARMATEHHELAQRYRSAEEELLVRSQLSRIAAEGADLVTVPSVLNGLTGGAVVIVSDDGRVLAATPDAMVQGLSDRLSDWLEGPGPTPGHGEDGRGWLVVAPVRAAGMTFGHLALAVSSEPTPAHLVAAEQAGVASALLLARDEAAVSAVRRLQSEFVWDLLDGRLPDEAEAVVRGRHVGAGFALPARVAVVGIPGLGERAAAEGSTPDQLERTRAAVGRALREHLEDSGVTGAVVARRADVFAIVVPCRGGESRDGAVRLGQAAAAAPAPKGLHFAVGVGGVVTAMGDFPEGYRQARLALSAVVAAGEPVIFEDLGVLQFLLAPASRRDLDAFARRLLGPLVAYDAAHGSEMVRTLQAYVDGDWSTRRAAERMGVHHKTVCYRLQRVEELTGLSLGGHDDRFHAQLALKILGLAHDSSLVGAQSNTDDAAQECPPG